MLSTIFPIAFHPFILKPRFESPKLVRFRLLVVPIRISVEAKDTKRHGAKRKVRMNAILNFIQKSCYLAS